MRPLSLRMSPDRRFLPYVDGQSFGISGECTVRLAGSLGNSYSPLCRFYSEMRGDEPNIDKKSPRIMKATMRPEINITYISAIGSPNRSACRMIR